MSAMGNLGQVVTYRAPRAEHSGFEYSTLAGDYLGYTIYVLRRLWRRAGRPVATLQYGRDDGSFGGRTIVVDLETGRSVRPRHEDRYFASYLQVSFWRDAGGLIRVGRQGAISGPLLLDVLEWHVRSRGQRWVRARA